MRTISLATLCVATALLAPAQGHAQCVADPFSPSALPFDADFLFRGLDQSLGGQFAAWLTRWQQENPDDPTPGFVAEDNSQNGIDDDDHLDLLAALLGGDPAASVLSGIAPANVAAIRASYAANRAKVRPDLTLTIIFVTVNIIDEINADAPDFGASLQDLVAAYMTIGDAESVAYIRGLLITLGEIFIEIGVDNGDIPSIVEGLTKTTLRNTVNANFVSSRYECYGDVPGATKPNLLGDTGNISGNGLSNEAAYAAAGRDRQAWLIGKGITQPPLQFVVPPVSVTTPAGVPAALSATIAGGTGAPISYDWKLVNTATGITSAYGGGFPLGFSYPLSTDAGTYQLFVCDGTWIRASLPVALAVTPAAFAITAEPAGATRGVGGGVEFTAAVRGGERLPAYQWFYGSSAGNLGTLDGATAPTLSLDNLQLEDAGFYQCRITGGPLASPVTLSTATVQLLVEEALDETPPVITVLGANPLALACGTAYTDPGATASDDVDGVLTQALETTGTVNPLVPGQYTITYAVADAAGNPASASRAVIVADTDAPVLTLLGANPLTLGCKAVFTDPGATASDICAGTLNAQIQAAGAVNTNLPGTYTRTYSVADPSGNTATLTRTVNVVDTTPPQITRIGAATINVACGGVVNDPGATATDACADNLTQSIVVSGTVDANAPGSYTRTYTVADPSGNSASTSRTYVVADTTPPVLTLVGASPLVVPCGTVLQDPGATALDVCDGDVSDAVTVAGTVNTNTPGAYQLTYSATDSAGNTGQISRVVNVIDTTPPIITVNGATTVNVACKSSFSDPGATALDACGNVAIPVIASGSVDTESPGSYTLTYTATDSAGNAVAATRTVNVVDDTPPIITLNGATLTKVNCGSAYTERGAYAQDACDGLITEYSVAGTVDTETFGDYTLVYTITDASGNSASLARTVTVKQGPPIIRIDAESLVYIECGGAYTPPTYSATDPCLGDITDDVLIVTGIDEVNTNLPGLYEVTFTASDAAGNTSTPFVSSVYVEDTTPPILDLIGEATLQLNCGDTFTDPGAAASDLCDGDLNDAIVASGPVDAATPGTYTRTYSVADSSGNSAAAVRTINVVGDATAAIVLAGGSAFEVSCGTAYAEPGFTATDTCGNDASGRVVVSGTVAEGRPGAYALTYALSAASGGPVSVTRTVTVLPDCAINFALQPRSLDLYVGQRATFNVIAEGGSAALTYQWYENDDPIAGAISPTYTIETVSLLDGGAFYCRVSDGFTEAVSDTATLAVFARPLAGQQSADTNGDWSISLSELLRLIQFYNTGEFSCVDGTEDGYAPGAGDQSCAPHSTDYNPQNWALSLSELLRAIQFYNTPGSNYRLDEASEDGFAPGAG